MRLQWLRWMTVLCGVIAINGCDGTGDAPAGPGLPGGPPAPPAGRSTGHLSAGTIDASGGSVSLLAADGSAVTLEVPAGALDAAVTFTLTELTPNTAFGGVGTAWRIEPRELTLSAPLMLRLTAPSSHAVADLTAAYQDAVGYWYRVYSVARDAASGTVAFGVSGGGDWSLVTVRTTRDLLGPVSLTNDQGLPFSLQGDVVLQFLADYSGDIVYAVTGTLVLEVPVMKGAAACTPASAAYAIRPSIAELRQGTPPKFQWGINGHWELSCDDGAKDFVSTNFDSLGITNHNCARTYLTVPVLTPTHVRGQYEVDCGARGRVVGAWDLVAP